MPMHVHILKGDGELVVNLGNDQADISVRNNYNMRETDVRRALQIINLNYDLTLEKWREIHG